MKKFGALNKISRRDFLRLTGSVAGAVAFSERCLSIPEALAAPVERMEDQSASQSMYATVAGDTPDESAVDLGPDLDLFWAAVEPYQMSLDLEHFRHLVMGLACLNYAYLAFEVQCQTMQWELSDPDGEAYVADEAERAGVLAEMVESRGEHLAREGVWLPPESRWPMLVSQCDAGCIGELLDEAMLGIIRENPLFEGSRSRSYCDPEVIRESLTQLVLTLDAFEEDSVEWDSSIYLGQIYASWLAKFAVFTDSEENQVPTLTEMMIFAKYMAAAGGKAGDVQDDINYLGPKGYPHPKIKPFFITPTTKCVQYRARVAFDGTNYLVIWSENRYSTGECLFGCRVTPQGKILDPGGVLIHAMGEHLYPRLAAGKDKTGKPVYLLVWVDRSSRPHAQVKGVLIRSTGKVQIVVNFRATYLNALLLDAKAVNSAGIYIFPDIEGKCNPWKEYPELADYDYADVAFNGTDFVVTCIAGTKVVARLVDPNDGGVKVEQPAQKNVVYPWGKAITIKLWDAAKAPYKGYGLTRTRIASGGGNQCLITWHKLVAPGVSHLWGIKVNFYGTSWKVGPPKVITKQLEPPYGDCSMASDGSGSYMLAWNDLSNAKKKKKHPGDTAWPDLARAAIKPVAGNPQDYTVKNFTFMMKANHSDYYSTAAFDGKNYLISLGGVTSDLVNFHKKLGCLVGIVIAGYVSPDAKLLDAFFIKPEYGGSAQSADVCFGKTEGLMVYEHIDANPWNTTSYRKLRLRFIGKSA